jgi:flagellar basal-body rod protein FlgB
MSDMISGIFNSPTNQALRLAMDMSAARHEAISSNIANVNSPNYKRMDITTDFKSSFDQTMSQLRQGQTVNELPQAKIDTAPDQVGARLDGNTVNLDMEMVELMKVRSMNDLASQMLSQNYKSMKTAITGRSS